MEVPHGLLNLILCSHLVYTETLLVNITTGLLKNIKQWPPDPPSMSALRLEVSLTHSHQED